jgi:2-methylisocitrate lyase-like PEP mutase family enzyme
MVQTQPLPGWVFFFVTSDGMQQVATSMGGWWAVRLAACSVEDSTRLRCKHMQKQNACKISKHVE